MSERPFDVVVLGATGFTGGLVTEYLRQNPEVQGRFAIAGRNADKLARVCERIGLDVPTLSASIDDPSSLRAIAEQTRCVLSTVGPYARYGEPVVRACVAGGADYVDITGEPAFVDETLELHDGPARDAGVRIVSCCGFDSIPHDLGVWCTVRELPADSIVTVDGFVHAGGTFSGGTWHSAIGAFAGFREHVARRRALSRSRGGSARRVHSSDRGVHYSDPIGAWAVPFPSIDPEVVLRSARTLPEYGRDFTYGHFVKVKKLHTIVAGGIGLSALFALAQAKPTRELLLKVKAPGDGPSQRQRDAGWFRCVYVGHGGGREAVTVVHGGDPGYTETAKMLSQSALCLARDRDSLPERFGVLTTAEAMAESLVGRLRAEGIHFDVTSSTH